LAKKILVICAHPDDELLGVAGTLLKHKDSRDKIYICMLTKAYESEWTKEDMRKKIVEQKKVDELLGVTKRYNLDFPTVKLNTIPAGELNKKITDVVDEVKPDIIYTHFEHDVNYDHTIIFRGCLVATRPPKKIKLLCYETLSETEWGSKAFQPNYWVDIKDYIDKKIELFKLYTAEVKKYPHPRSPEGVRILAQKRGADACKEYVEAFMIIKDWWM